MPVRVEFTHHGQRVVVGQRLMQSASDMFLGWMTTGNGAHYYIRQLRDMKFSVPLDTIEGPQAGTLCGHMRLGAGSRTRQGLATRP